MFWPLGVAGFGFVTFSLMAIRSRQLQGLRPFARRLYDSPWWIRPFCGGGMCVALPSLFVRDLITGSDPASQTTMGFGVLSGVGVLGGLYVSTLGTRIRRAEQRLEALRSYCEDADVIAQIDTLVDDLGPLGASRSIYLGRAIARVDEAPDRPRSHHMADIQDALSAEQVFRKARLAARNP